MKTSQGRFSLCGLVVALVTFIGAPALAVSVEEVPNPQEERREWVSDTADVISATDEAQINRQIDRLEEETGVEVAVVTVNSTDTPTTKDFATELFNEWGIGKKDQDNGLLILLDMGERRLEMETGYGTEAVLTDGWLKRMQQEEMIPDFKQDRFGAGMVAGVEASVDRLEARADGIGGAHGTGGDVPADRDAGGGVPWWIFALGGGLVLVGGGYYRKRTHRKCPECKTKMELLPESTEDRYLSEGEQTEEAVGSIDYDVFFCRSCGEDVVEARKKWFSGHAVCPECQNKTVQLSDETLEEPTTTDTGLKEIRKECAHCSYTDTEEVTLPTVSTTSSSGSGGGGFSGGGGSVGGGGSFGGGASGGGGAGSSF